MSEDAPILWNYPPLSLLNEEEDPNIVPLLNVMKSYKREDIRSKVIVPLGKNMMGDYATTDLKSVVHSLIIGNSNSGKFNLVKSFIASLLFCYTPEEIKFVLIDFGQQELSVFDDTPFMLTPTIRENEKVYSAMRWIWSEIERRNKFFSQSGVRNIIEYNELSGFKAMPDIIVVIEELSNLTKVTYGSEEMRNILDNIIYGGDRTGIHVIATSQRPTKDIVSLFPTKISFSLTSATESQLFLGITGAERLISGDMLYLQAGTNIPVCIQGVSITPLEITRLRNFIASSNPSITYEK